ncbi:methyltransferase domain-containing protein [Thiorhodococcus mannitoliphagus]|uniref:Methyltransferase domain-containing protein n=1 Tax=Thiorhodococcus mannitoliphagus TaxID=329406 RepID=A0A6P1DVJ4_9GAMM|nr:methyltransferase domain-containing protein [Thiorhodococcus mannitoliphagus]NEX19714.1 methyltransferase domain-containing protein [Thiorhodococcus mannitoliphagus]
MIPAFFSAMLRSPRQVGAVAPSGIQLANAMASQIDPRCETILELGPGTGAITVALVRGEPTKRRLVLVERDARLARALAHRFPSVQILTGDASHLHRVISSTGIQQFDTVVSSLPLLSMSHFARARVVMRIFAALSPGGKLVQYTYSTVSPISRRLVELLDMKTERVAVIFKNLPPASVWVYTSNRRSVLELDGDDRLAGVDTLIPKASTLVRTESVAPCCSIPSRTT